MTGYSYGVGATAHLRFRSRSQDRVIDVRGEVYGYNHHAVLIKSEETGKVYYVEVTDELAGTGYRVDEHAWKFFRTRPLTERLFEKRLDGHFTALA